MPAVIYKILIGLGLALGIYLAGYWMGKGDKEVIEKEKIVLKEGRERIVYKDRIVTKTVIRYPDGRVEETEKVEEKESKTEKESEEVAKDTSTHSKPALADYRVGAKYWASYPELDTAIEVEAGRRLLGDIWIELGVRADGEAAIGVAIQW